MLGFWVFMLVATMLIPVTLVVASVLFLRKPPIDSLSGYRSTRSIKSEESWKFAQEYCGKLWLITGGILVIISIIIYTVPTLYFDMQKEICGTICGIMVGVQMIIMFATVFQVEKTLKKNFDSNGDRK